jgi:hypothetical protein
MSVAKPHITHRLVGYDRATDRVVDEYVLPEERLAEAKVIAHVPADDDPNAALCYLLAPSEARARAGRIDAHVDPAQRNYFFEGFIAPPKIPSERATAR